MLVQQKIRRPVQCEIAVDLNGQFTSSPLRILMIGKGSAASMDKRYGTDMTTVSSYASVLSSARTELNWLISSLTFE